MVVDLGVGEVAAPLPSAMRVLSRVRRTSASFSGGRLGDHRGKFVLTFAARGLAGALRGVLGFSVVMVVLDWSSELLSGRSRRANFAKPKIILRILCFVRARSSVCAVVTRRADVFGRRQAVSRSRAVSASISRVTASASSFWRVSLSKGSIVASSKGLSASWLAMRSMASAWGCPVVFEQGADAVVGRSPTLRASTMARGHLRGCRRAAGRWAGGRPAPGAG